MLQLLRCHIIKDISDTEENVAFNLLLSGIASTFEIPIFLTFCHFVAYYVHKL